MPREPGSRQLLYIPGARCLLDVLMTLQVLQSRMNRPFAVLLLSLCMTQAAFGLAPFTDTREIVGPMLVIGPAAWAREALSHGPVVFLPAVDGVVPGESDYWGNQVHLWSTNDLPEVRPPDHQTVWNEVHSSRQPLRPSASGRFAGFEWSEMVSSATSPSTSSWYRRLYTMNIGNEGVAVLVFADSIAHFRQLVVEVEDILSKAQFEGQSSVPLNP
jgi:hypothetical protein